MRAAGPIARRAPRRCIAALLALSLGVSGALPTAQAAIIANSASGSTNGIPLDPAAASVTL